MRELSEWVQAFVRERRAAGAEQIVRRACGTPWEGNYNSRTVNHWVVAGYVYQSGGRPYPGEQNVCGACVTVQP